MRSVLIDSSSSDSIGEISAGGRSRSTARMLCRSAGSSTAGVFDRATTPTMATGRRPSVPYIAGLMSRVNESLRMSPTIPMISNVVVDSCHRSW